MLTPAETEARIFAFWQHIRPSEAFLAGFEEFAGRLFIPSSQNVAEALEQCSRLRDRAPDPVAQKILDSYAVHLRFREPQPMLGQATSAIFDHLVKEGIRVDHLHALVGAVRDALAANLARLEREDTPAAIRILTQYRAQNLQRILETVAAETTDPGLQSRVREASDQAAAYARHFAVDGFREGTYEEVADLLRRYGDELGRQSFYPEALQGAFDYHETPAELESTAMTWLEDELRLIRDVVEHLAAHHRSDRTIEAVTDAIARRNPLPPEALVSTTERVRGVVQGWVHETLVHINPRYSTRVIETPPYLTGSIPSAAAGWFNSFTDAPFQLYFITTDARRDPMKTLPELLAVLVHEEYGHCVHHANSALRYAAEPRRIELLHTSHAGPTSEGLSFNRELEFAEALREALTRRTHSPAERAFLELLDRFGGAGLVAQEIEFEVRKARITRFLRVIGDARINAGFQSLLDFLDWASAKTGLSHSHVYFQLFPAHEGIFPGYATCYAVVGQEIRRIQQRLRDREQLVRFNTYACSQGYPPRSVYRQRLEKFAAGL